MIQTSQIDRSADFFSQSGRFALVNNDSMIWFTRNDGEALER